MNENFYTTYSCEFESASNDIVSGDGAQNQNEQYEAGVNHFQGLQYFK